jgi:hypothetical protein
MQPDEGAQDQSNRNRYHSQDTVPAVRKAEIGEANSNDGHSQEHAQLTPPMLAPRPGEIYGRL